LPISPRWAPSASPSLSSPRRLPASSAPAAPLFPSTAQPSTPARRPAPLAMRQAAMDYGRWQRLSRAAPPFLSVLDAGPSSSSRLGRPPAAGVTEVRARRCELRTSSRDRRETGATEGGDKRGSQANGRSMRGSILPLSTNRVERAAQPAGATSSACVAAGGSDQLPSRSSLCKRA
ncbi:unnamed protein product, partial [Urochloa humidicola]